MVSGGTTPKNTQLNGSSQSGPLSLPSPLRLYRKTRLLFSRTKIVPAKMCFFFPNRAPFVPGPTTTNSLPGLSVPSPLPLSPFLTRPSKDQMDLAAPSGAEGDSPSEKKRRQLLKSYHLLSLGYLHGDSSTPRVRIGESLPHGASSSTAHFPTTASPPTYYLLLLLFSRQYIFPNGPSPSSLRRRKRKE